MKKVDRVKLIRKILDHFFPSPTCPLKYKDAYTLLIAVLLSSQTTDEKVNQITPLLFALANTPKKMVEIKEEKIREIINPCGLSKKKAKAILLLSQKLLDDFKGKVPHTLSFLESLPLVGHKTASVVLTQAFQKTAFPIDTHIHRCARRWGLSKGKNVKQTEKDLKKLFPKNSWGKIHLQIIYFARKFCTARGHKIKNCPICSSINKYKK